MDVSRQLSIVIRMHPLTQKIDDPPTPPHPAAAPGRGVLDRGHRPRRRTRARARRLTWSATPIAACGSWRLPRSRPPPPGLSTAGGTCRIAVGSSPLTVAQRVETHFPQLGDALASAVEFLGQSEDDPAAGSAQLRRHVITEAQTAVDGLAARRRDRSPPAPPRRRLARRRGRRRPSCVPGDRRRRRRHRPRAAGRTLRRHPVAAQQSPRISRSSQPPRRGPDVRSRADRHGRPICPTKSASNTARRMAAAASANRKQ